MAGICQCSKYVFLSFLDCLILANVKEIKSDQVKMRFTRLILMITEFIQIGALWLLTFERRLNPHQFKVRLHWVNRLVLILVN